VTDDAKNDASERVRVLWLTKGLGRGGVERLISSSIRHFDRDRFDVEVAYLLPWKDAFVEEIADAGVPVHCLGVRGWAKVLWPLRLRRLARAQGYDIVHTHMPLSAAIARVALGRRPRFVHTEHNVWERHRRPSRWANSLTFGRNAAVVAVSASVAQSIHSPRVALRKPPVEVLLHGINLNEIRLLSGDRTQARRALGLDRTDVVIGTVGNFTRKKNQQMLLHATALLAERIPNVRLVLIGTGPLEENLRRLAVRLGIGDRTIFAGSRDDVLELLPGLDVFCLSSQFEGLSIALVEAMATGIACVATAVGGIPEVIEDGVSGLLVPSGATAALADTLERVLLDESLKSRLSEEGGARAMAFDIGRAARRLQALYEEMMAA
jgi:glycosyltransferase involved in cell wall biosynthesis